MIKQLFLFGLVILCIGCNIIKPYKYRLGQDHILVLNGISGRDILLERGKVRSLDSIYCTDKNIQVLSFDLVIKFRHEKNRKYTSSSNKITWEMKDDLMNYPFVECIILKNIKTTSTTRSFPPIKISFMDYDS